MVKKAQISMFILIGMVLLVFAGIFYYASELMQNRVDVRTVEASDAKQLVEYCLGAVADDALLVIGRQGGIANLQTDYFTILNTTYLFDRGENKALDSQAVEQELSSYIEQHLSSCTSNFENLIKKGIAVTEKSQPKATTTLAEKDVRFEISYDIEEKKGDIITRPEFLPAIKVVKLKEMVELADSMAEAEKNNGMFDLDSNCGLEITHFPVEKTLVTIITDKDFLIQDKPYRFVFAHRR